MSESRKNNSNMPCPAVYQIPADLTASGTITPGGVIMTGEQLKAYRLRKHLTQQKLGELLGFTGRSAGNTVQKWEYGSQPIPVKYWKPLTKILGVKLEEFLPD